MERRGSDMMTTATASFVRPPSQPTTSKPKQPNNPEVGNVEDIPPLERIPTNQFIERFLEEDEDEDDALPGQDARDVSSRATDVTKRHSAKLRRSSRTRCRDQDDTETVLDITESHTRFDDTGQQAYERACKRFNSTPCSAFHRKLAGSTTINLGHYNTGPRGAKAIAIPMLVNTTVTSLNLKGNDLNAAGIGYICEMLLENTCINELNLADNKLRTHGAKLLSQVLAQNQVLKSLDLSGNQFTDQDAKLLAKPLEEHTTLRYVNLSHNEFGSQAGTTFRPTIGENGVLHEIDLSWNQIRMKGAIDLAKGVKENVGLKVLNLSWNGFGGGIQLIPTARPTNGKVPPDPHTGVKELGLALKNCTLVELDLSNNRVNDTDFVALAKGFKFTDDLKTLNLRKNPISGEALISVLSDLQKAADLSLEMLDLGDINFAHDICNTVNAQIEATRTVHPNLTCRHGYTDSYGKRRLKSYNIVEEALNEMQSYCDARNINIVELFSRFDADGSMSVSHDEFKQGLKEAKIPLTDEQIELLINTLDQDGDGEIDFSEMVMGAEMFKNEES